MSVWKIPELDEERKRLADLGVEKGAIVRLGYGAVDWEVRHTYRSRDVVFVMLRSLRSGQERTVFSWEIRRLA